MPIYEYCCPKCGLKFELLLPMSKANEDAACPTCKNGAKRAVSSFAAFTKSSSGSSAPVAGAGGGCSGCSATSCSTCR